MGGHRLRAFVEFFSGPGRFYYNEIGEQLAGQL
jgi:hypothetical protein